MSTEDHVRTEVGRYTLDLATREAKAQGRTVRLTKTELAVLCDLMESNGETVPREKFSPWKRKYDYPEHHPVKNHIVALNKKLDGVIEPVPGVGYRLRPGIGVRKISPPPRSETEILGIIAKEHLQAHAGPELLATIANCEEKIKAGKPDAETYFTLARAYLNAGHDAFCLVHWVEAVVKAKDAIAEALALNDRMSSAYALRGLATLSSDYGWKTSKDDFLKALTLNPDDPVAHVFYAHFLISRAEFEKAIDHITIAVRLAPTDRITVSTEAWMYLYAGQHDKAIIKGTRATSLFPSFPAARVILGWAYQAAGDHEKAVEEYEWAVEREFQPEAVASLGNAYASLGNDKAARETLERLDRAKTEGKIAYVSEYNRAMIFAGFGKRKKRQCLDALERALDRGSSWLTYLNVEPRWNQLRNEERFQEVVRGVGLEPRGNRKS